jgi:hypothetical protein
MRSRGNTGSWCARKQIQKLACKRNRLSNETGLQKKKEQGGKPCSKNCVDPISPKNWI